ncbi:hypothetical protein Taro_023809 [Colocasia esculenta]|uniref:GDSL esterase/lipase n=1 Tax=Colocasia esculenta TaxID=4460 RepID=A0A843VBV7_COLES|nr:hypothetical protein [Colocasia esculenta]
MSALPSRFTFFYLLASSLFLASTTGAIAAAAPGAAASHVFSKIYAFGDSFTDTGNTNDSTGPFAFVHASDPPYGATFFRRPTNRYSDGRLVVDFLAAALALPFLPPYLDPAGADFSNGANFAVAGATAIDYGFFVRNNVSLDVTPQSLATQLGWFERHLQKEAAAAARGCRGGRGASSAGCGGVNLADALFWVGEIGVNDFAYTVGSVLSPDYVGDLAVDNVARFLEALLQRGAKYMVVQGQPLAGCLPLTMSLVAADDRDDLGCSAVVNRRSAAYNALLQERLRDLRRRHPGAVISYADYAAAHRAVMRNPAAYGFSEPFRACCGSGGGPLNFDVFATCGSPAASRACGQPGRFVNWDGVHLTEAMYRVLADMFFRRGYTRPPFAALLDSRRRSRRG